MSDVVYQLDAIGGNKVDREVAVAEKAINKVGRASSKSGFAILEASRAIEDFSMAGMKGAINNIPGLLMHLGVGMGLTGVISVATVAVWKGVDALEAYLNKLHDAKMAAADIGVGTFSIDDLVQEIQPQAIKQASEMAELYKEMANASEMVEHQRSLDARVASAEEELRITNESVWAELTMADEAERKAKAKEQSLRAVENEAKISKSQLANSQAELDKIKAIKDELEKDTNLNLDEEADKIKKRAKEFYLARQKELAGSERQTLIPGAMTAGGFQPTRVITSIITELEAEAMAKKEAVEFEKELQKIEQERLKELTLKRESAKLALDNLKPQLDAAEKQYEQDKLSEEAARRILDLKREQIEAESKLSDIKEQNKQKEMMMQAMLKERVTDPSAFLTSQGRAGLSGRETQSAMGLIGIARQQLSSLKQIERNTRNFNIAYA